MPRAAGAATAAVAAVVPIREREFSAEQRKALAQSGAAMPDGGYPIENITDLRNAIQAFGRAANPAAVKRHIIKRARALGQTALLPDSWKGSRLPESDAPDAAFLAESVQLGEPVPPRGGEPRGLVWDVTLITAGLSKNQRYYSPQVLRAAVPLFEGVKAFADHPTRTEDRERPERSVRDVVGWFDGVRWDDPSQSVKAQFHISEAADWLRATLLDAWQRGKRDLIGLSINSEGRIVAAQATKGRGTPGRKEVTALYRVASVDVVTDAGAGGGFERLLASGRVRGQEGDEMATAITLDDLKLLLNGAMGELKEGLTTYIDTKFAGAGGAAGAPGIKRDAAGGTAGDGNDGKEAPKESAGAGGGTPAAGKAPAAQQAAAAAAAAAAGGERETEALNKLREVEMQLFNFQLDSKLRESKLPDLSQARLREQFSGRIVAAADLDKAVVRERDYLAALLGTRQREFGGAAHVLADGHERQRKVIQMAWDRFFGIQEALRPEHDRIDGVAVPRWQSLREAYGQTTGDFEVLGHVLPERSIIREVNEVTTTVLNEVVLNSMTKRLVQDYAGQPQEWRRFCTFGTVRDFKRQDRILLNDFASLSTVAEGGAYTNLAWDDKRETYTPSKRGNLVVITRETILNDDIDAVRKVPTKLAIAAGITINEFVYITLIAGNPTMADGSKVFDDGVQTSHANRGTAALSSAALTGAIAGMLKQTNSAGKRIGQRPRFLLVPPDLWATANVIVGSTLVPGSANNDVNVLRAALEPITVPQFTDATNYYLFADPAVLPMIELGFVGGQETPELLVQDSPTDGSVFTNDQISYKVRWEFGGGFVDFRGAHFGDVAG